MSAKAHLRLPRPVLNPMTSVLGRQAWKRGLAKTGRDWNYVAISQ